MQQDVCAASLSLNHFWIIQHPVTRHNKCSQLSGGSQVPRPKAGFPSRITGVLSRLEHFDNKSPTQCCTRNDTSRSPEALASQGSAGLLATQGTAERSEERSVSTSYGFRV